MDEGEIRGILWWVLVAMPGAFLLSVVMAYAVGYAWLSFQAYWRREE